MKATKFKLTVEIETLSLDTTKDLLIEVVRNMKELPVCEKVADDGDFLRWEIEKKDVEF